MVEKLGTVLQLTMTFEAITNGPQLGIFSMGILFPWVNSKVSNIYKMKLSRQMKIGVLSDRRLAGRTVLMEKLAHLPTGPVSGSVSPVFDDSVPIPTRWDKWPN